MVLDKIRTDGLVADPRGGAAASSTSRCRWATAMSAWWLEVGRGRRAASPWATAWSRNGKHAEVVCVPDEPVRPHPRRRERRGRPPSPCSAPSPCRASGWRSRRWARRGGHRPGPDRPADGAAAARARLPGAGHRLRPGAAGAGAAVRRRDGGPGGGRGSAGRGRRPSRAAAAWTRCSSPPRPRATSRCTRRRRCAASAGRIVLVGVTGLELSRADFYEKELTFQVSCSYGPGRYDPALRGRRAGLPDRLRALDRAAQLRGGARPDGRRPAGRGAADLAPLRAGSRRSRPTRCCRPGEPSLGILLQYPAGGCRRRTSGCAEPVPPRDGGRWRRRRSARRHRRSVAFIGAGNYAGRVLIPAFKAAGARLQTRGQRRRRECGPRGTQVRLRPGQHRCRPPCWPIRAVDTVVIATRHDSHARSGVGGAAAGQARVRREAAVPDAGRTGRDRGRRRTARPGRNC